jgi:hypothetical protein
LSTAEYVVLVEGPTDIQSLAAIFSSRSAGFRQLVDKGKVVFDHMEGTGNVLYRIRTLQLSVATPILITDDDKAGRAAAKKAIEGGLQGNLHFYWKRPNRPDTELEDLFDPDCYWEALQTDFPAALDRKIFDAAPAKWASRMRAAFEGGGKMWTGSLESNVKVLVAKRVNASPDVAVRSDCGALVDSVLGAIVRVAGT